VVAALGGISAHRGVAGAKGEAWWSEVVGPGLALDTLRFRVLGIDYSAAPATVRRRTASAISAGECLRSGGALPRSSRILSWIICMRSWAPPTAAWWRWHSRSAFRLWSGASSC
jgi:hypothetical protein